MNSDKTERLVISDSEIVREPLRNHKPKKKKLEWEGVNGAEITRPGTLEHYSKNKVR